MKRDLTNLEIAILDYIINEVHRIHFNKHQSDFDVYCSDFLGLDGVEISPYYLADCLEKDLEPNIIINGKKFWFYKYYGRGMETDMLEKVGEEWLEETLKILEKLDE